MIFKKKYREKTGKKREKEEEKEEEKSNQPNSMVSLKKYCIQNKYFHAPSMTFVNNKNSIHPQHNEYTSYCWIHTHTHP